MFYKNINPCPLGVKTKIFHDQELTDEDDVAIKKFAKRYVIDARSISKETNGQVYYGFTSKVDTFLARTIPIEYVCNCSIS